MDPITSACRSVLEEIDQAACLIVGFSGGLDSTVLLHALVAAKVAARVAANQTDGARHRIIALHVDHGLVPDSQRWAQHCATIAERLGVEFSCEVLSLTPGSNLEARARQGRYRAFAARLGADDVLLLAHHQNDQDETILLHLLQGRGLFGIPPRRSLGAGQLRRPLLRLPRSNITAYAREHSLNWLEDPGNDDLQMDRNYLRGSLLPQLNQRFPGLSARLERMLDLSRGTQAALVESLGLKRNPLPLAVLEALPGSAKVSVLRHWLIAHDRVTGVRDVALASFASQLGAGLDRQPSLNLPRGSLRRYRGDLYLLGAEPDLALSYDLSVGGVLQLPHGTLSLIPLDGVSVDVPDSDLLCQLEGSARVTFAAELVPGSRLLRHGLRRKVMDLMRDAGLPPWLRVSQPLLVDDRGPLAIAAIAVRDPHSDAGSSSGPGQDAGREQRSAVACRLCWQPSSG